MTRRPCPRACSAPARWGSCSNPTTGRWRAAAQERGRAADQGRVVSALHLTVEGAVAELRLDNPAKLNSLTVPMLEALDAHCATLERAPEVRVVIVTGTGEKAFCTGADITAWGPMAPFDFARHWVREGHRIFDRLARLGKPTIAALNGHTFGGGLELAAACDIRVIDAEGDAGAARGGRRHRAGLVGDAAGGAAAAGAGGEGDGALRPAHLGGAGAWRSASSAEVADDVLAAARAIAERAVTLSPRAVEVAKYMIQAGVGEDRAALIEALGSGMIAASEDRAEGRRRLPREAEARVSGEMRMTVQDLTLVAADQCRAAGGTLRRPPPDRRRLARQRRRRDLRPRFPGPWRARHARREGRRRRRPRRPSRRRGRPSMTDAGRSCRARTARRCCSRSPT